MGRIFVSWTNTLSKPWGEYSSVARIPSQNMGRKLVRRTNALSKAWGEHSSVDEYPLKNMERVFVPWTNPLSKPWGKYSSIARRPSQKHGNTMNIYSTNGFESTRKIYSNSCGVCNYYTMISYLNDPLHRNGEGRGVPAM